MPKFAANLTMLYNEVPFLDRFERAAKAGFDAVEFLFPYAYKADEIKSRLRGERPDAGAAQPAGRRLGRRRARHRLPARPRRRVPRRRRARPSSTRRALGCKQVNCLAGKAPLGASDATRCARPSSRTCATRRASSTKAGIKLLIEPINTRDIPGFYLCRTRAGARDHRRGRLGQPLPAVRHLPRADHGRRARRDAAASTWPRIAHIQLADNPGRNEPGTGEINYALPVRAPRPHRLQRLGRLRVQAGRRDRGRPRLVRSACARRAAPMSDSRMSSDIRMKIGFIGLGIMGAPMAANLHQGRPRAVPAHAQQRAAELAERGATRLRVDREVARAGRHRHHDGARHARRARRCCSARTASPPGLSHGKTVVDMSSISPIETKEFAQQINALGCDYLDAPVSGGEVGAKAARADHHGRRPARRRSSGSSRCSS